MSEAAETVAASGDAPGLFESLGKKLDDRPEIQAAEEAVRQARERLDQAQQYCQRLRNETAAELKGLGETKLGDLLEKSVAFVREHPGSGVGMAAALGFLLGRIFRR